MKHLLVLTLGLCFALSSTAQTLRVLNWGDYIDPELVTQFERENGVSIEYVEFNSEEEFNKLFFERDASFDVVFPSSTLLGVLSKKDLLVKLDKTKIQHFQQLNPEVMRELEAQDPGNQYGIPYMWGTTGIGVNTKEVKHLGLFDYADSWSLIFDANKREKLKSCGIGLVYERDELFAAALIYLGYPINTKDAAQLDTAGSLLKEVVADAKYVHSTQYTDDLGAGKICVGVGYSGDILAEMESNPAISYNIPREGASMWFDMMAIPSNSENKELAYQLINFLSTPEIAGTNSNYIAYPTPVDSAKAFVDAEILADKTIYPSQDILSRLQAFAPLERKSNNIKHRLWVKALCSNGRWCVMPMKSYL